MTGETCDACAEPATRITRHERPNTGTLVAYWCEQHVPTTVEPGDYPSPG